MDREGGGVDELLHAWRCGEPVQSGEPAENVPPGKLKRVNKLRVYTSLRLSLNSGLGWKYFR